MPVAIDRYLLCARAGAQLQTHSRMSLLLSIDGTDGRTPNRYTDPSPCTRRLASIRYCMNSGGTAYHLIINEFFLPRHNVVIYVVGVSPRVVEVGKRLVDQLSNDRLVDVELVQVERVAFWHPRCIEYVVLQHVTRHARPGMLTRPAGHEAKAEAEARKSEAEDEAEAQNFFRGRGQTS